MEAAVHKVHLAIHREFVAMDPLSGQRSQAYTCPYNTVFDIIQIRRVSQVVGDKAPPMFTWDS